MGGRLRRGALLALGGLWSLSPFIWELLTSFKPAAYLARLPPIFPPVWTPEHYRAVLENRDFARLLLNSAGIAALTSILSLALGSLGGFALACLPVRGKGAVLGLALCVSMFPAVSILLPLSLAVGRLGLRDTWAALILSHAVFTLPLTLWVLRAAFRGVPIELFHAALVDGLTPLWILLRVYLPLARGGLAACGILNFIFSWNEFLFALTFTSTDRSRTLPVGIALFQGVHETPFGELAAAAVLVSAPVALLAMLFQKGIVSGLTAGSVKG
jgi:multiple sugar transport system permease protein